MRSIPLHNVRGAQPHAQEDPKIGVGKCQWDRDDYSFNIDVMVPADEPLGDDALEEENPSA